MTISAIEFGEKHGSCAMGWRLSLGPGATQAYAYQVCNRGDHLIWQLQHLPDEKLRAVLPALLRAVDVIVVRAARAAAGAMAARAARSVDAVDAARSVALAALAAKSAALAAGARYAKSAVLAARAAADAARSVSAARSARAALTASASRADAWTSELKQQAEDIRTEIPEWPGE